MHSEESPINHTELEWILIELPMELFTLAESLNQLRLEYDIFKLEEKDLTKKSKKDSELGSTELELNRLRAMISVYSAVITRVENEISYSKELIMGAKKIWDRYRAAEASNPVGEVVPEGNVPVDIDSLPMYGEVTDVKL